MNIRLFLVLFGIASCAVAGPAQFQSLTVNVQGSGLVSSNPSGVMCPDDCSENYAKGTTVFLTAIPELNSSFLRWEGSCTGTAPTCQLKMATPRAVTAVFDPAEDKPLIPILKTGQTECWGESYGDGPIDCAGTGQDAEYLAGVSAPTPRYVDNGNGTITDTATGLTWLRRVECMRQLTWPQALAAANGLADGQCDLSDGSAAGDWRLPNANEILSLASFAETAIAGQDLRAPPFVYVFGENCGVGQWTSTTAPNQQEMAYLLYQMMLTLRTKATSFLGCAFPVKGGL